jgi:hypothetical protein
MKRREFMTLPGGATDDGLRRGHHPPGADRQDVKAIERRRARSSLRRLMGSRRGSCTALSHPLPALRGERVG